MMMMMIILDDLHSHTTSLLRTPTATQYHQSHHNNANAIVPIFWAILFAANVSPLSWVTKVTSMLHVPDLSLGGLYET